MDNTEYVESAIDDFKLEVIDAGEEARANLLSGVPIYYAERNTPEGCVIKEYPDGRKELVSFMTGTEKVVEDKSDFGVAEFLREFSIN